MTRGKVYDICIQANWYKTIDIVMMIYLSWIRNCRAKLFFFSGFKFKFFDSNIDKFKAYYGNSKALTVNLFI